MTFKGGVYIDENNRGCSWDLARARMEAADEERSAWLDMAIERDKELSRQLAIKRRAEMSEELKGKIAQRRPSNRPPRLANGARSLAAPAPVPVLQDGTGSLESTRPDFVQCLRDDYSDTKR